MLGSLNPPRGPKSLYPTHFIRSDITRAVSELLASMIQWLLKWTCLAAN